MSVSMVRGRYVLPHTVGVNNYGCRYTNTVDACG
jgi:hypothetical protein